MPEIKFSHDYPKLWGQTTAKLIHLHIIYPGELNEDLIEYDTKYKTKPQSIDDLFVPRYDYYPLKKGVEYLQLVFLGNKGIPFCTIRRHTARKALFYGGHKGDNFKIVIAKEPSHA